VTPAVKKTITHGGTPMKRKLWMMAMSLSAAAVVLSIPQHTAAAAVCASARVCLASGMPCSGGPLTHNCCGQCTPDGVCQ
jgi:hypothetical protein